MKKSIFGLILMIVLVFAFVSVAEADIQTTTTESTQELEDGTVIVTTVTVTIITPDKPEAEAGPVQEADAEEPTEEAEEAIVSEEDALLPESEASVAEEPLEEEPNEEAFEEPSETVSDEIDQLDALRLELEELLQQVIGFSDFDLSTIDPERIAEQAADLHLETNLGNFCADAYRIVTGSDIAFVNDNDLIAGLISGELTYEDLLNVQPSDKALCLAGISGDKILDALEFSVSKLPDAFDGYLHVSGLKFYVDLNVESSVEWDDLGDFVAVSGERRVKNVTVLNSETGEYEALDPEKVYFVSGPEDLLMNCKDGYTMFTELVYIQTEIPSVDQALVRYFLEYLSGAVTEDYADPLGEGRITIVNKGEEFPADLEGEANESSDDETAVDENGLASEESEASEEPVTEDAEEETEQSTETNKSAEETLSSALALFLIQG